MKLFVATVIVYTIRVIWATLAALIVAALFVAIGDDWLVVLQKVGIVAGLVALVLVYGWADDTRKGLRR